MKEMDFYVDLLDNSEADKILRLFNEKVPGFTKMSPPLDIKKNYIKKVFQKQTPKTKKGKEDPFYFHLKTLKEDSFTDLEKEEFFMMMEENERIPDHAKFGLALKLYPDVTNELMPKLLENKENGKPVFSVGFGPKTEEQVKDYLYKTGSYIGEPRIDTLIETLGKYFNTDEDDDEMKELKERIEKMNLLEFYNEYKELKNKYKQYQLQYLFVKTHEEEDENIRLGLLLDVADQILEDQSGIILDEKDAAAKNKDAQDKLDKTLKKEEELIGELKEKGKEIENLKNEYKKLQNEMEKLKKEISSMEDKKCKEIEQIKKSYEDKIQKNPQTEISSFTEAEFKIDSFAMVYSMEVTVFHKLFPEIYSFNAADFEREKEKIKGIPMERIYIQRDGMSTKSINKIRDYARQNNIMTEIFFAGSEKELIEQAACFKRTMEGSSI